VRNNFWSLKQRRTEAVIFTLAPIVIAVAIAFAVDRTFGWLWVAAVALMVLFSQVGMPA
jgi:hypothetical protein